MAMRRIQSAFAVDPAKKLSTPKKGRPLRRDRSARVDIDIDISPVFGASTDCPSSHRSSAVDSVEMHPEIREAVEASDVFSFQGDAASGAISGADCSHIKDRAQELADEFDDDGEMWSRQSTAGCFGIGAEVIAIHSRQATVENIRHVESTVDQHVEKAVEGIRGEASPLRRELEESRTELAELRAQFAENNVVGTLRKQLMQMQELKKENEALRQGKPSLHQNEKVGKEELPSKKAQSSLPAIQDLFTQCGAIVEQNDALMSEMEKLKQQHEALTSDYELLARNHHSLNLQCIQQRNTLNTHQDEKAVLKHESDMAQHSYDCLNNIYITALDEQKDLQSEHEDLLNENEGLKSHMASFATIQKSFMTTQTEASFSKQEKPVQRKQSKADVVDSEDTAFSLLSYQLF